MDVLCMHMENKINIMSGYYLCLAARIQTWETGPNIVPFNLLLLLKTIIRAVRRLS